MAGKIPKDFIEDLISRADIVDVIDARVKLKKAGRNYQACCPFHNEKTPSFSVSQEKQFYYCFGCGAKGNVVSFIMDFDRLAFPEAIEELAGQYGLDVPREKSNYSTSGDSHYKNRDDGYFLMEKISSYYQYQLKNHANAKVIIDYLKQRGLTGEVAKAWGIGYAPPEWDSVLNQFGSDDKKVKLLLDLKLINQNDKGKKFDFFRNRVMFPIRDKRGRVVAFGGRIIDGEGPKYLNSPETSLFHKGQELYGLYDARQANRKLQRLLVVEGYMDVVSLSQFGIDYAVAALGTATTPEHIQLMLKSTNEIIFCYDGDSAGRKAAWRALENAISLLKDGCVIKFMFLPDGEDPDTMVRKIGKQEFELLFDKSMPLSRLFFEQLIDQFDVGSIEGKAGLRAKALPMIEKIMGHNQKNMFENELNRICGSEVMSANAMQISTRSRLQQNKHGSFEPPSVKMTPVRTLIKLLLNYPEFASQHPQVKIQSISHLNLKGMPMLLELHRYCLDHPEANIGSLLEAFRDHPHIAHLSSIATSEIFDHMDSSQEYVDSFKALLNQHIQARLESLITKGKVTSLTEQEEQEILLLQQQLK